MADSKENEILGVKGSTSESDKHLISPHCIITESNRKKRKATYSS